MDETMTAIYLWVNAGLYLIFSVLCFVRQESSANGLGFVSLNESGRSEYAVVYGGLQLGLALFFAYCAYPGTNGLRFGLVLALALYVPIALVRWITVWHFAVRSPMTLGIATLETLLLLIALALWFFRSAG